MNAKRKQELVRLAIVLAAVFVVILAMAFVSKRAQAQKAQCVSNLKQIQGAKESWALESKKGASDVCRAEDVTPYLKNSTLPICPMRGSYEIGTIGGHVICTITNHALPPGWRSKDPSRQSIY